MMSDDVNAPVSGGTAEVPTDVASRDDAQEHSEGRLVTSHRGHPEPALPRPNDLTELEAPDQETPTQALKILGVLCVIASVLLLIPRQYVSSAIAFILGVTLLLWRHLRQRREGRRG